MNAILIVEALLGLAKQTTDYITVLRQAQAENRDVTDAELAALKAKDDVARQALADAIAKARGKP